MRTRLPLILLLAARIAAQNPSQLVLQSPAPSSVTVVSASPVGVPGARVLFYWVVANYPGGSAVPSPPVRATQAPANMSGVNFIRVSWNSIAGVTSYTVLRHVAPDLPLVCTCVAGTATTASFDNTSDTLTLWNPTTVPATVMSMTANSRDYAFPRLEVSIPNGNLFLRQGLMFPDATVQTTAAGGSITSGVAGQFAYYSSPTVLVGDSAFTRTANGRWLFQGAGSTQLRIAQGPAQGIVNLLQFEDAATNVTTRFDQSGAIHSQGGSSLHSLGVDTVFVNNPTLSIQPTGAARPGIVVRALALQTGNLQEWQDSGANPLARISPDGTVLYRPSQNVASADPLVLPDGNLFHITGANNINTINTCDAGNNARRVTLIFDGILTVGDGSNLKLAGNFVTTADDSLTIICDGANWYEVARSIN